MNKTVLIEDKLIYLPDIFSKPENLRYFAELKDSIDWEQNEIMIFGKKKRIPRLSSWYGDQEAIYKYSGIELKPKLWTEDLLEIKNRVEKLSASLYNSVLLNYYRSGQDSMGWHSDDEKEIAINSTIASVTFGSERRFLIREKANKSNKLELRLESGSVLLMKEDFQKLYQHSVPKTKKQVGERINLTFRKIEIR